ncbi:MAG TPA: rhomboid family intramembrane serine protease [Bacteroidia bacterium]|nr:rhomboid family intramembrane serine protease [Bacteroidia bacterium]HRH07930.1 rhomboid family intramembrane serine protease [Bacteroidia bacterium]
MNTSLLADIKKAFKHGNALTRIVLVNCAVFLLVNLSNLLFFLFAADASTQLNLIKWLAVPADLKVLLFHKPWTLLTYMFLHEGFFHILSNMIMLYFGGQLFIEYLGEKKFTSTYFLGGIAGAVLYILVFNIFPVFSTRIGNSIALGASASVLAVFVAVATYLPNFTVNLLLLGTVRLKFIALFLVMLDLISIDKGNPGGHIAHLGGAMYGYFAMTQLRKGRDIASPFDTLVQKMKLLFSTKSQTKLKVAHKKAKSDEAYRAAKKSKQEAIDLILDKISKSGYESLTAQEKEELFKMSKD